MIDMCVAYLTCDSRDQVEQICQRMVHERLAAAANYFPLLTFKWVDDRVDECSEWAALIHTREDLWPELFNRVSSMLPSDHACVLKLDVTAGFPYAGYIADETQRFNEAHR